MDTRGQAAERAIKNKRGPKKKELNEEVQENKEQNKFFIDLSKDSESRQMILSLLTQANNKSHGREIILKDLVLAALPKLTSKEIEKIQEGSLSEMEKVERALDEHNKKNDSNLTLGEFLVKKLGIN
ncbi:MAG TPA: hypothetical protein VNJ08_05415 [Bacteriovoracaceae bacterium]|nr:hypothetical protein [Bacteriovoracaceae bacterium]